MKHLLLVLFIAFLNLANAQDDASFEELVQSYRDSLANNPSKALEYVLQAKSVAVVQGDAKQLSLIDYYIANCKIELEQNKAALTHIESAITQAAPLNDIVHLYNCLYLKGYILSRLGEDSKALDAYIKAKTYAKELQDPIYEIAVLCPIAYIKKIHKDHAEAITLYKDILKQLTTLKETGDTKHYRLVSLVNIADTYLRVQNTEEAKVYNEVGLNYCSKEQDAWAYYPLVMNKAIIKYQEGQYEESIILSQQVEAYAKKKDESSYLTSLFYLGKNAYKLQLYNESIAYLEKAYTAIKTSDNVDTNEKELHEFLGFAYQKVDNSEKAAYHFRQYSILEKKQSAEDLKVNNETHALVDVVPLKTEIDALGEQLTQETKSKKGFIITSVLLLLVLISSVLYYRTRSKRIRTKFTALLQKVSELEEEKKEKIEVQKETVPDEKVQAILKKLTKFEKNEAYLSKDCSLSALAETLETNTAYLSKVINTYKGKSFTAYITELRIETALVQLKNNKTIQSYTIMAIADEFGFKRQETFSRAFKAYTGMYPSQYIRNLKEKG